VLERLIGRRVEAKPWWTKEHQVSSQF